MEVCDMSEAPQAFKPRPRIQSLSDLIFGLALSISALTMIGHQPATFEALMISLGLYGFSFLILISVWRLYSSIMSVLPTETSGLTDVNILLLFMVSVEPYLFNELFASSGIMLYNVSNIYALDLAAMLLIIAFFEHSLADEEKNLVPRNLLKRYKLSRNLSLLIAAVFIVSTAPFFGYTTVFKVTTGGLSISLDLRATLWIVALLVGWSRRFFERAIKS
jgi:uncharacterized membrane protein